MERNNKSQIIHIHGGDSFDTDEGFYSALRTREYNPYAEERQTWRKWVQTKLADNYDFIAPQMPNAFNARYQAWAIWFEKLIPYLHHDVIFIGYSLGGGFLLRYLTENQLPVTIKQLHIVAGVVDNKDCDDVGDFTIDMVLWTGFKNDIRQVHLWYASDDPYIPMHHGERLAVALPAATLHTFTDRGHFFQSEFPELLEEIKK